MKRLFTAINFSPQIKEEIFNYINILKWPERGVSVVKPENYHITLRFWGNMKEEPGLIMIREIKKDKIRNYEPFKIVLSGIGLFPDERRPKYIVINIEKNEILDKIARDLGEEKKFRPHITLIRIKKEIDEKYLKQLNRIEFKPIEFEVKKIDLMNSQLDKNGSIYTIEKEYKL